MFLKVLMLILGLPLCGLTQETSLVIGTKEAPPFSMKAADGEWSGIAIELWQRVAVRMGKEYRFVELPLPELLSSIEEGKVDMGVSAITVTSDREEKVDFSHSYFNSGLAVGFLNEPRSTVGWLFSALVSTEFVSSVLVLTAVIAIAALAIWSFERKRNKEEFGGGVIRGIGESFWWSAVTMTTVGYGDKSPRTLGGRLVAVVWMFISIMMISGLTAAIASAVTVSQLESDRKSTQALSQLHVGVVNGSTGAEFAQTRLLKTSHYNSTADMLDGLKNKQVDVVIHDAPILRYLSMRDHEGKLMTRPQLLTQESYAIAIAPGSPMRETLNRCILEELAQSEWKEILHKYLSDRTAFESE